jgi:aryl-alcohol dehydrogenase-like predicted oxidoreductase
MLDYALEQGVNFVDTANVYSETRSESVLGDALQGKRNAWIIASKVGNKLGAGPNDSAFPGAMSWLPSRPAFAGSRPIASTFITSTASMPTRPGKTSFKHFSDLIRSGKIRHWGLSNVQAWQIAHVHHLCRQLGASRPQRAAALLQFDEPPTRGGAPARRPRLWARDSLPYSPLARWGVLTGKYSGQMRAADPGEPAAGARIGA